MVCNMGIRSVNFWLTFSLLCLCYGVEADVGDPKAANREATQQDFWQWVATVEQNHQAAVLAGTANPVDQAMDATTLAAASGNTLYVGKGGYKSVQAAVDAVPSGGSRHTIQISSGTWK